MVSRRTVLQSAGSAMTVGLLGGCLSQNSSNGTGTIKSVTVSTFHSSDGTCSSAESGSIEVKANPNNAQRYLLSGTLITPNPCHAAEVKSAEHNAETGVTTIVVTAAKTGGSCAQCVGEVTYSGAIEFKGGTPGTIRVEHESETDSATTEFQP